MDLAARKINQIPVAHVLSPQREELRTLLSARRTLVETRARYVTTIRGLVRGQGRQLPSCSATHFVKHARATAIPESTRKLIAPLLGVLEPLNAELAQLERELEPAVERASRAPPSLPLGS